MAQIIKYPYLIPRANSAYRTPREIMMGYLRINAAFRTDPTRTTMLRTRFVRQMNRRFGELKRDIRTSIMGNDCFGIQPGVLRILSPVPAKAYEFKRTSEKVRLFMEWLEEQERLGILEIIMRPGVHPGIETAWTDVFIDSAYSQGMRRGRAELRHKGYVVPTFESVPGGVGAVMSQPYHADRIGAIYTRTYEDLKSVTQVMNAQVRRQIADGLTTGLARGLAEGKNPQVIARELVKDVANRVDKIGITRARTIARTEVIRAHHVATIAEYEQAGVEMADWATGGNPCGLCIDLRNDGPYSLKEIEGMIPAHPNCTVKETTILTQDILAGMIAKYSGPIFKLAFANGARLSVTPNHMLATPDGFVMTKFLSQGDAVLCGSSIKASTLGDPDDDRNPARIDNVIQSLAETPGVLTTSVPVAPEYFHGDGGMCQGNIDIVNPDGLLRDNFNTKIHEMFNQTKLNGRGIFDTLFADGSFSEIIHTLFVASDSSMCRSREVLAFLRGFMRHAKKHGFALISGRDSILLEAVNDDTSCAAKMLRNLFNRQTSRVFFEDLINVYRQAVMCDPSDTKSNSSIKNPGLDGFPFCYAISNGQLRETFSGQVSSVCLMGIEVEHVSDLLIYDVSTSSTIYFTNGILSSNCTCCALPVIEKERREK